MCIESLLHGIFVSSTNVSFFFLFLHVQQPAVEMSSLFLSSFSNLSILYDYFLSGCLSFLGEAEIKPGTGMAMFAFTG